jgi:cell shape-determining protein MreC
VVSSRSRTLLLIVFFFLAAFSLRKQSEVADRLEDLFRPARALRSLAAPLVWLSAREVRAAESALAAGEDARRAAARAVLEAAQVSAAPSERSLSQGRGVVHAEVVDRLEDDPDRVVVHFAAEATVEPGMPVVCGDYYVGRVASVQGPGRGEATVDLVTRRDFRVGGVAQGTAANEPPLLVVGGLVPRGPEKGDRLLAVHCPSDPDLAAGEIRVRETDAGPVDRFRGLADGFLLGWIERVRRGGGAITAVRPGLDYESAVSQIGILCPSAVAPAGPDLARDPFLDARWLDASFALPGDASFWREGRVLLAGYREGVREGAALAVGASFLGTVASAGPTTSKVALLGDPGLELTALACLQDPSAPPLPIGRLVSLGRDRADGSLRLRWNPSVAIGLASDVASVVLYTASGHRSVPPGLRIGTTELPRGRGPFVLRVRQEADGLGLTRARVWREIAERVP